MLAPTSHPITDTVTALRDGLVDVADRPTWSMSDTDLDAARVEAHRLATQVAELELRLAAAAIERDVDVKTAWVRETHQTPRQAATRLNLAKQLDTKDHEPVRTAMATGAVTEAQARVVVRAVDHLPKELDPDLVAQAQEHLLDLCADHHPDELRRLGRHLLRTIAPEVAEAHEAAQVDAEYRRAMDRCRFSLFDRHDGTWEGRFVVSALHAQILRRLVMAFAAPKHRTATGQAYEPTQPSAQRQGAAFCELLEQYPTDRTPHAGGVSARVMVEIGLDDLTTRLHDHGVAWADDQIPLPAWEARRLACEAGVLPAVLGGESVVLDLGRTRRFHTPAQRILIARRERTCRAEGCDWPASMSHVHHVQPWSRNGPTDLANAMALCAHHHRRAHDPTYEMSTGKRGRVVFRRT